MEVWKKIEGHEDYYVSNYGNIKSIKKNKERFLSPYVGKYGYKYFIASKSVKERKTIKVHQAVAVAFLNHKQCGMDLVVNHINLNKSDNRVENLEIVTSRVNSNKLHIKSSSKYVGVSWHKRVKKWVSSIYVNGKNVHLGCFDTEEDAYNKYLEKLNTI